MSTTIARIMLPLTLLTVACVDPPPVVTPFEEMGAPNASGDGVDAPDLGECAETLIEACQAVTCGARVAVCGEGARRCDCELSILPEGTWQVTDTSSDRVSLSIPWLEPGGVNTQVCYSRDPEDCVPCTTGIARIDNTPDMDQVVSWLSDTQQLRVQGFGDEALTLTCGGLSREVTTQVVPGGDPFEPSLWLRGDTGIQGSETLSQWNSDTPSPEGKPFAWKPSPGALDIRGERDPTGDATTRRHVRVSEDFLQSSREMAIEGPALTITLVLNLEGLDAVDVTPRTILSGCDSGPNEGDDREVSIFLKQGVPTILIAGKFADAIPGRQEHTLAGFEPQRWHTLTVRVRGDGIAVFLDGVAQERTVFHNAAGRDPGIWRFDAIGRACDTALGLDGRVAEVIAFESALEDASIATVHAFLAQKYGLDGIAF